MTIGKSAKAATRRVLRWMPAKTWLARRLALMPPPVRSGPLLRVITSMIDSADLKAIRSLTTNLGICRRYRLRLATDAPMVYFFGTPDLYAGERGALQLVRHLSRYGDAFVDVGSYHGYFVFYLRHFIADLPVYYFEPDADLYREIEENLQSAGVVRVHGRCAALGAERGQRRFYVDLSDRSSSSLHRYFANQHVLDERTVSGERFDAFVQEHGLRNLTVKVDVENGEVEFFRGAESAMESISFLIIEVLAPAVQSGFVRAVQARGFQAYYVNDHRLEHSADGTFRYRAPQYNWLFCRLRPADLRSVLRDTPFVVAA
jgi:FkbM family methyltransferase